MERMQILQSDAFSRVLWHLPARVIILTVQSRWGSTDAGLKVWLVRTWTI
jgi:hypothetical protein